VQSCSQVVTINKPTRTFLLAGFLSCRPTNGVTELKGNNSRETTTVSTKLFTMPIYPDKHQTYFVGKNSTNLSVRYDADRIGQHEEAVS